MAYTYSVSLKAYSKIILHCCKYRHLAVNGVVIGSISKETQTVQIQDAIPLFHSGIGLAPMLEVSLMQVCIMALTRAMQFSRLDVWYRGSMSGKGFFSSAYSGL